MMQKLRHNISIRPTETFTEEPSFQYLVNNEEIDLSLKQKPYPQVFASKFGFVPNMSGIDLLCNMGNAAREYLR
jgi:hypothetical protein